jgi:excisionase family DNA binding protein
MSTREVADYLRLKERKVYELVRTRRIPCTRVTGKWLFPRALIDAWLARNLAYEGAPVLASPPVAAGSQDPLFEWALRESGSDLALLAGGSADGLRRVAEGDAAIAGVHILDSPTGDYNVPAVRATAALFDVVVVEWAKRMQGLILASGNPLGIAAIADLAGRRGRVARRQDGAGAHTLFLHLLDRAGVGFAELDVVEPPALSESELAAMIADGKADCGVGIQAAARRFRLDFVPLHHERFDLVLRRRDYFEVPAQTLLAFARTEAFRRRAEELGGYDLAEHGRVVFNA